MNAVKAMLEVKSGDLWGEYNPQGAAGDKVKVMR